MQFEILYRELANGPAIVASLLAGVSQTEAQVKLDPKTWSFLEVICHLYDEEREDFHPRLDLMLHRPKDPWPPISPGEWVTERKYNERDLAATLKDFAAERAKSLAWLKNLDSPNWEAECKTPFGIFKTGDILAAWVAHDNLHTRQLVELRRGRILRITEPYHVQYAGDW
jgi:hypothetical protein